MGTCIAKRMAMETEDLERPQALSLWDLQQQFFQLGERRDIVRREREFRLGHVLNVIFYFANDRKDGPYADGCDDAHAGQQEFVIGAQVSAECALFRPNLLVIALEYFDHCRL